MLVDRLRDELGLDPAAVGIVVVDHGSRRAESNALLDEVVTMFVRGSGAPIVEAAHMELAEPSIATAFARCVARGATTVVVFPYFLSPGRHWSKDIPALAGAAAAQHPGVRYQVTSPLGLHELLGRVIEERITQCLGRALNDSAPCDLCRPMGGCRLNE
ncbi:MAG: CbiX/SirB N-terminal domain-containing protein [Lacipirellulaceae bacterium]